MKKTIFALIGLYLLVYFLRHRGDSAFAPVVNGSRLKQPQLPVTLPTYDEVIGSNGISNNNYNEFILSKVRADRLNG